MHAATLRTGERVVVKVQRRRVAPLVRLDVAAMAWIAPFLVGRIPVAALTNPPALVELFAETIVEELDFRLEAQNMLDIAEVFAGTGQRTVVVPRPHPELVTRRVLVMEHLHGFSWGDAEAMRAAGIDTAAVLRSSLIAFLEGALLYGVFHGDLHGGNLIVQSDGTRGAPRLRDHRPARRAQAAGLPPPPDGRQHQQRHRAGRGPAAISGPCPPTATSTPSSATSTSTGRPSIPPRSRPRRWSPSCARSPRPCSATAPACPKELMLFVKNMLFLNGAMATMAPDVDILGEIVAIVTYFTEHHGERIAREVGFEVTAHTIDLDGYRAAMGFADGDDAITFRDLQERRELIAKRLEAHEHPRRRVSVLKALYRLVRPVRD